MSKKSKYRLNFSVNASTFIDFEARSNMSASEVECYVEENNLWPYPSVCCQCSDEIQIDDLGDLIDIHEEKND